MPLPHSHTFETYRQATLFHCLSDIAIITYIIDISFHILTLLDADAISEAISFIISASSTSRRQRRWRQAILLAEGRVGAGYTPAAPALAASRSPRSAMVVGMREARQRCREEARLQADRAR